MSIFLPSFPDPLNYRLLLSQLYKNAKLPSMGILHLYRSRKEFGEGHFAIIFANKVKFKILWKFTTRIQQMQGIFVIVVWYSGEQLCTNLSADFVLICLEPKIS